MPDEFPKQYLEGLRLFNDVAFFDCHDVLEELWTEVVSDEKEFYQGLIQASVALFHFRNQNYGGAMKLYLSANKYLAKYQSPYMGIDLETFLADFKVCFQDLLEFRGDYPSGIELKADLIPKIDVPAKAYGP